MLRGLRDLPVPTAPGEHRLLDEVEGIGSVSGETFTAAYYALHRDRIFTDFERDFLKRDVESYIWGIYLLPWNWAWMFHPLYGTNDVMQEVYDGLMFHGIAVSQQPMIDAAATLASYGD